MLQVPFYKNPGGACMQVAMKCVLEKYLHKTFSIKELDELTGRKNNKWTYTSQGACVLHELGLNIRYYSKVEIAPFLKREFFVRYIQQQFGEDAEKILKLTDLPVVINSIRKVLAYNIFKKGKLSFRQIEGHIEAGYAPIMLIDHSKIDGGRQSYQGHFVIMTGFDQEHVFYHQFGPKNPQPNKRVKKELFKRAWNARGTDNDVIIVFDKNL